MATSELCGRGNEILNKLRTPLNDYQNQNIPLNEADGEELNPMDIAMQYANMVIFLMGHIFMGVDPYIVSPVISYLLSVVEQAQADNFLAHLKQLYQHMLQGRDDEAYQAIYMAAYATLAEEPEAGLTTVILWSQFVQDYLNLTHAPADHHTSFQSLSERGVTGLPTHSETNRSD